MKICQQLLKSEIKELKPEMKGREYKDLNNRMDRDNKNS